MSRDYFAGKIAWEKWLKQSLPPSRVAFHLKKRGIYAKFHTNGCNVQFGPENPAMAGCKWIVWTPELNPRRHVQVFVLPSQAWILHDASGFA